MLSFHFVESCPHIGLFPKQPEMGCNLAVLNPCTFNAAPSPSSDTRSAHTWRGAVVIKSTGHEGAQALAAMASKRKPR